MSNQVYPYEIALHKGIKDKIKPIEWKRGIKFLCHFCGGKKCKHEDYRTNPNNPAELKGLNCDWITKSILAMQRPSSRLISQYCIPELFNKLHILSIFCLQEPGEHPYCGDGIHESSGLSYLPEEFYEKGIKFYNFGWEDHQTTNFDILLKILKSLEYCLSEGKKVAVHCHAGRGRTALVICCYLIYSQKISAKEAIDTFKKNRNGKSLSQKSQRHTIHKFEICTFLVIRFEGTQENIFSYSKI